MISVIIPTCNRNELLSNCLERLSPTVQCVNELYEVIVTDDGKDNYALDLIKTKYSFAKWVKGPQKGPAANRNNGAKYATKEWLIFIDDDCLPDKNLITGYYKAIQSFPEILAFEGRIGVNEPQNSFLEEAPINEKGGYFWSCNIAIKRNFFNELNGFDEQFPYAAMEDADLFKRIKQKTNHYMFVPNAYVVHPWRTNKHLFKTILNRQKSQLYYISKYPEEKEKVNFYNYIRVFVIFLSFTLRNALKFKFKGFVQKLVCDFLQLYFGLRILFKIDKV